METAARKPFSVRNTNAKVAQSLSRLPVVKRTHSPDQVKGDLSKRNRVDLRKNTVPTIKQSQPSTDQRSMSARNTGGKMGSLKSSQPLKRSSSISSLCNGQLRKASSVLKKKASQTKELPAQSSTAPKCKAPRTRPAWDLKGRLLDMEKALLQKNGEKEGMIVQLEDYNSRVNMLKTQNNQLVASLAQKDQLILSATVKTNELQTQLSKKTEELDRLCEEYQRVKPALEEENKSLKEKLHATEQEREVLEADLTEKIRDFNSTKVELKLKTDENVKKTAEINELKELTEAQDATIKENMSKIMDFESERRRLHNSIQELKGNIRVFCRVRPLLEGENGIISHINFPDADQKILEFEKFADTGLNESIHQSLCRRLNKYEFNFDKVFSPSSTQVEVFSEVSQLVQSALDGYNVCIFAYGQTGSGKTYTMEGPATDATTMGIIPRATDQIFETARELQQKGWEYDFEASFLEIYNEAIRDLLQEGEKENLKYEIKQASTDGTSTFVTNLTVVSIQSRTQIHHLLQKASQNRAVAETRCNERSSRSHSVFRLKIHGANEKTGETCLGNLNLVDLAGSERLKESHSEGLRLRETQCINKSLSNLSNVIMALANKEPFVPYRNSKLTYLLQNSLGGNSKTLMFVNLSPKEEHSNESLISLRFATTVNQCNIGTAQKRTK